MTEHIILVALEVEADTRENAITWAEWTLGRARTAERERRAPWPNDTHQTGTFNAWWTAEDDRMDNSDNDSAVFVHRGRQYDASLALARLGFAPESAVKGEPDGERFIVTTTVYDPKTGTNGPPVSLDNPGVTRTKNDARDLRNSYVLTIGGAGAVGSPACIYPAPDGTDREAYVVEYRGHRGAVTMRETVTFIPADQHPPHVRHTQRSTTCPACGNSGTTPDFLDTHTCVPPGTQHVDLLDDPWGLRTDDEQKS